MKNLLKLFSGLIVMLILSCGAFVYAEEETIEIDTYDLETKTWSTEFVTDSPLNSVDLPENHDGEISPMDIFGEDDRVIISDTTKKPYSYIGNIYIRSGGVVCGYGTGFLVGPSLVLTAAHNLYSNLLNIDSIRFLPGHNGDTFPFGKYTATKFHIPSQYKKDVTNKKYDYALIELEEPVGNKTGYFSLNPNLSVVNNPDKHDIYENQMSVTIAGYPSNDRKKLYKSSGKVYFDGGDYLAYTKIDTDNGQSGSPVYYKKDGKYYVLGIHIKGNDEQNTCRLMTNAIYRLIEKYR